MELWQQATWGTYRLEKPADRHQALQGGFYFRTTKKEREKPDGKRVVPVSCFGGNGAGVHCLAADKEQARIVFRTAKAQMLKSKELSERGEPRLSEIRYPAQNSYLRVLSSETASKHGLNSSMVVFDELHAIKDRELIDVLQTAWGA